MSPNPNPSLTVHEGTLVAIVRETVAAASKHAETITLAGQQLQQVLQDLSGDSAERQLRGVAGTVRAITVQLALVALDVSAAVGELEAVAGVRAAVELDQ